MSTDLFDWVESLKRATAPPGDFDILFPDSTDAILVGNLLDAFGECQLDGFFNANPAYDATVDGIVTPDMNRGQMALILIYASVRIIRNQLANSKNRQRFEAKGALFETETGSNILTTTLKQLNDRKEEIVKRLRTYTASAAFDMADAYFIRAVGPSPSSDFYYDEQIDRAYDYHSPWGWG